MELYASVWILLRLTMALGPVAIPATSAPPVTSAFVATSPPPVTPGMIAGPVTPAMLATIADLGSSRMGREYIARNVWVQPILRAAVDVALMASPTLREQVRFLGAQPRAHIAIIVDPDPARHAGSRAHCEMRLYSSGVLIALVALPGVRDADELVAHELEHVIERLQGVNLAVEARRETPGTSRLAGGRYESQRAQDAGLRVKAEVANARVLLTSR